MKLKIRDVRVGDGVDLRTFPSDYKFDEVTWDAAEFEMAEVTGEFEVESPDTWVLHTMAGSFGVDPDWVVEVNRP